MTEDQLEQEALGWLADLGYISEDDFVNGLMQRFCIALCHDRPEWREALYSIKGRDEAGKRWAEQWERIKAGPMIYRPTASAQKVFREWFKEAWAISPEKESYIRRYAYSAFKYAAILNAVSESDGVIDAAIMEMALNLTRRIRPRARWSLYYGKRRSLGRRGRRWVFGN